MRKEFIFVLGIIALLIAGYFGINRYYTPQESSQNTQSKQANNQQKESQKQNEEISNTFIAVGDIMLSRHVGEKIRIKNDPKAPFLNTGKILNSADITFGNLESPFDNQGPRVTEGMVFKAEPETIEGLKYAGFDILSLANNHFGNRGTRGMDYTFNLLKENNIEYIGAGQNSTQAAKAKFIDKNGIKFAFLGYDDMSASITPDSYKALATKPGVNPLDEDQLKKDIKDAKKKADIVIVSFHWGTEYQQTPSDRQKTVGRMAIDYGASLVIGHHPHVTQPYEKYKEGYIFYSLGNFIFDQMWSEKTKKGEIAKITFKNKKIEKAEAIPITIYDYYLPKVD
ncbi:MAG: CapA family protein [Candidatus Berkelbacteria bacterium]|nr:CapA family protein [Candidatus Berkelbacteria bacterium]